MVFSTYSFSSCFLDLLDLDLDYKKERQKQIDILLDLDGRKINIELNNNESTGIIERNIIFASKVMEDN